jgi:hypothetical protein
MKKWAWFTLAVATLPIATAAPTEAACQRGYYEAGSSCLPVALPANAEIDYTGHGWTCKRGYRQVGDGCLSIALPANAEIDYTGHGWTCKRGYRQVGESCLSVALPANAEMDYTGHGWTCKGGYYPQGGGCLKSQDSQERSSGVQSSNGTRLLQLALMRLGYSPGSPDGRYGPTTAAAIRTYQSSRGLKVDGIAGPRTVDSIIRDLQAISAAETRGPPTAPATVTSTDPIPSSELAGLIRDFKGRLVPYVAENGSYYGEISENTGRPKTVLVHGYYRKDGTYVRGITEAAHGGVRSVSSPCG